MKTLLLLAVATGCAGTQSYGLATPSHDICSLGALDQELVLGKDFKVTRFGDHAYPSDASIRRSIEADAVAVKRQGVCPGDKKLGTFRMSLHRIEIGSTRGRVATGLMYAALLPTLGFSLIYPMSTERWLTLELDAETIVDGKQVWTGSFTSHTRVRAAAKDLPSTGSELAELMKKAQVSATGELRNASRAK